MRDPKGMGGRESVLSDLAKGREMGEDRRGCRRFAGWKGKEGSTASLAIHRLHVSASSQTSQLQASQVRGWQVRSSRRVYGGKEGNAASFYTNNSHNPADVALATSHSELAGVAGFAEFGGSLSSQGSQSQGSQLQGSQPQGSQS